MPSTLTRIQLCSQNIKGGKAGQTTLPTPVSFSFFENSDLLSLWHHLDSLSLFYTDCFICLRFCLFVCLFFGGGGMVAGEEEDVFCSVFLSTTLFSLAFVTMVSISPLQWLEMSTVFWEALRTLPPLHVSSHTFNHSYDSLGFLPSFTIF